MILFQDKLIDRAEVHIDIEDRGYQFGDGIYEVIRVYNGQFFGMEGHMKRLERSAKELFLELPYPIDVLTSKLEELLELNQLTDGHVYLQVSRAVAERTHHFPETKNATVVAYTKATPRPIEKMKKGIMTITTEDIRWLRCDIKSLNLLGNVLCKQKAVEANCDEAILVRESGVVTEGSSSNVFIVKDGELWTHPVNNYILNGITRKFVLDIAENLQLPVIEKTFDFDALMNADEVIVTSTTMEVCPVISIDGHTIGDGQPGAITRKLQDKLTEKITQAQNV